MEKKLLREKKLVSNVAMVISVTQALTSRLWINVYCIGFVVSYYKLSLGVFSWYDFF